MKKSKTIKTNSTLLKLCVAFVFPFTLFGGVAISNVAHADNDNYVSQWSEDVSVTNGDFTSGSTLSSSNSLSGWSAIGSQDGAYSTATGMFVDTGSGTSTGDGSNETFNENQERYMLQENPGSNMGSDSRVFMINSKQNIDQSNILASKGYRSDTITLEANSFYVFSVAVKTALNGDSNPVNASIYVNGLTDSEGNSLEVGVENITTREWKEYTIYIATGDSSQEVTVDLYLGDKEDNRSSGAVFFDSVTVTRYSSNAFFAECYSSSGNAYVGADSVENPEQPYDLVIDGETYENCYVVDSLRDVSALIDTSEYNFDFEDEDTSANHLGDKWEVVDSSIEGHAYIEDIRNMQIVDFETISGGYDYIGDDLTYQNEKAMILTTKGENGYVGVQSTDFEIKAHTIYKVSFNLKVAEITSGSFYFKVQENGTIYETYSGVITDNEDDDTRDYLALQDGQTSGYSSNVDDKFKNDYQTIEMYIKGHSLYDTSVNFQLWLGDSETNSNGCVIVDNITVEYADSEEFAGGSNTFEFTSFSGSPSTIPNSYFNATEFNGENSYPVTASDWTSEIEDENYNTSGVIYLYDIDHYNNTYLNKYPWAGFFPGHPTNKTDVDIPNNVYMMYNSTNSYQSLTSSSYTLSSDSYYRLSFNYRNENRIAGLNPSKIKVEIIDDNGITLFSKDNIYSYEQNDWGEANIYFHTAELVSHNIQVRISFGTEDDKVGGIVYLDNFVVSESSEDEFAAAPSVDKTDLTDYYLNLGNITNDITSTPAYNFTVEPIYDLADDEEFAFAEGGIISGKDNPYGEDYIIDDSNYLVLSTRLASRATLTSAYTVSMSADSYYKLTFDLATIFGQSAEDASTDEHDCTYGVTITIDGFEPITEIVTKGELKSFTIYTQCGEETTPTIAFTLVSDCHETLGTALITHIDFTPVTENEYRNASLASGYGENVFTAGQQDVATDDDTSDDEDTDTDTDDTTTPSQTSPWLLISSLIFGVAIIVAIIGFALRHIKIKKIEKIRQENYDRKLSKNHDTILVEAQKRRDEEVVSLQNAKKSLEKDKETLEENHKAFMKESRLNSNGKISKEVEREIKRYNNEIIRIDEKINIISEKIDTVMSAEYLLTLERRIVAEEDENYKNERKAYKAQMRELKQLQKQNPSSDNQGSDSTDNQEK